MPLNVIRGLMRGAKRGNLTSKRGNRLFYKGRGAKSTGFHTKKGSYIVQQHKVPQFIVPDLTGFQLKPYVSHKTPKVLNPPLTVDELKSHIRPTQTADTTDE
ncbi:large ribosomal subunit protein mL41-like [Corticium candelabrum]|uniref:large ribosomal subunit protein mL41-like n=1 Tax=Corticium candelabrum TaxID=121492 RepID=UPI002E254542|nr:large ribosomal subunit protein mL41-like [Corticium candelabrum]